MASFRRKPESRIAREARKYNNCLICLYKSILLSIKIISFTSIGANMSQQIIMVSLEDLVPPDHIYRRFCKSWNFESVKTHLKPVEKDNNYKGYGLLRR